MNLKQIREGDLKPVLDTLEIVFSETGTDFYIIGALARDIWFSRGGKQFRATKDVDFAVFVASEEQYQRVRELLNEKYGYKKSTENPYAIIATDNTELDILPFGEIAIDDTVHVSGEAMTTIHVNGFEEVYRGGTQDIVLETGHKFKIATLPSIVLLKLIAYDDRPEHRTKDPGDIALIIQHYFHLQGEYIYNNYANEFSNDDENRSLEQISAKIIGKEMQKLCTTNPTLRERLASIISREISAGENSHFIKRMVIESGTNVEEIISWLQELHNGLT